MMPFSPFKPEVVPESAIPYGKGGAKVQRPKRVFGGASINFPNGSAIQADIWPEFLRKLWVCTRAKMVSIKNLPVM
jgi:hypothetical protein